MIARTVQRVLGACLLFSLACSVFILLSSGASFFRDSRGSPSWPPSEDAGPPPGTEPDLSGGHYEERVDVVVASMKKENTSWISAAFPQWTHRIYVVDDPDAALTVPMNKGHEVMVYLTYVCTLKPNHAHQTLLTAHPQLPNRLLRRPPWHSNLPPRRALPMARIRSPLRRPAPPRTTPTPLRPRTRLRQPPLRLDLWLSCGPLPGRRRPREASELGLQGVLRDLVPRGAAAGGRGLNMLRAICCRRVANSEAGEE